MFKKFKELKGHLFFLEFESLDFSSLGFYAYLRSLLFSNLPPQEII